MHKHTQSVSRRSVTKGAAWAVPAVAVAAAAPSLAASSSCTDEQQILTQTFETPLGSWVWDLMTATVTMSILVPTCVRTGDVIVPQLTATLTAPGLEEKYSGRGFIGDFEFFYNMTGSVAEPQGRRVRFTELSLYRDAAGELGFRVSGVGASEVVAATGDTITVGSNPLSMDTYFADYESDFYATGGADAPLQGAITVA